MFIKQCFCTFFNDQCSTIHIYIHFIYIQLQFIGHFKLCNFICTKSFKSQIMHFSISLSFYLYQILPMLSVHRITNHRHGPAGLQAGIYIYIYIYIYVLGWCTIPILSLWATDRYATIVRLFDSYWYTNLFLTRILTANILLRALKSFNTIYDSIYIYICMQIEHFHIHAILLCKFVSQTIVSNHLKQIISNTNQYELSCQSFPKFKPFRN